MRLAVSGTTRTMRRLAPLYPQHLAHLLTPATWNKPGSLLATGLPLAADNAAFTNFSPEKYRDMLAKIRGLPPLLFVCLPDVVGDARETLERFALWRDEVALCGHPLALVGQDGVEDLDVPWDQFGAYFVGGTDDWKLTQASADVVREAKRRGKWVHMGRVNSYQRLESAYQMGCDSVDGSSMSRFGDTYVEDFARFVQSLERQPLLF